jgi:sulfur-carrier protein adenylyltransferase/sulfurtransferase
VSNRPAELPILQITATALKARLDAGESLYILDVRNPDEWEICALPNTVKVALPTIQTTAQQIVYKGIKREDTPLSDIPTDQDVIVYCHGGTRSAYAIMILRELGYDPTKLFNLDGGIDAWSVEADPSVPRY